MENYIKPSIQEVNLLNRKRALRVLKKAKELEAKKIEAGAKYIQVNHYTMVLKTSEPQ